MKSYKAGRVGTILFVGIVLVSLVFDFLYFNYTTDDAFISFRYARNLARGLGLVFNPGERVEGFTNFLWTILMVPAFLLGVDILIWHKILGIIFSVLTLFVLWRLSLLVLQTVNKNINPLFALIPVLIVSIIPSYAIYNINGMENPLFIFLLTLGAYLLTVGERYFFSAGITLGLLSITRPEGIIFLLIAIFVVLVQKRGLANILKIIYGFIVIYFPFVIFRAGYYGELFPNTFYAKLGVSPLLRMKTWGAKYIADLVRNLPYGLFVWATILCVPYIFKKRSPFLFPFLSFWAIIFYSLYIGGDPFPYFRIFSLVVPMGAISILGGLIYLSSDGEKGSSVVRYILLLLVGIWSIFSVSAGITAFKELNIYYPFKILRTRPLAAHWELWAQIGERLKEFLPRNSTVVVQDVGAIPFYSDMIIIDPIALVDSTLAHFYFREGYNDYYQGYLPFDICAKVHKFARDYIFDQRKADAILYHLDSRKCDDMSISFHYHYLYLDPRFDEYEKIEEFKDKEGKCVYVLYSRKNLIKPEPVRFERVPKRSRSYILY